MQQDNTFASYYLSPETIPEELHCSICTYPFVEPVTLKARCKEEQCNHTFCSECISAWLHTKEGAEHRCPYCQTEVSRRFSTADRPICNMVDSLRVRCKYFTPPSLVEDPVMQGEGCGWIGARSEWSDHLLKECAFREVECPHHRFGCGWSSKKSLLDNHLKRCPYEAVNGLINKVTQVEIWNDQVERMLKKVVEEAEEIQEQLARPPFPHIYNDSTQFRVHTKELLKSLADVLLLFHIKEDEK